jgi:hypothetical protein
VVPRWTYTRTKLETADRAKENLKPTAFSSTRSEHPCWGVPTTKFRNVSVMNDSAIHHAS